LNSYFEGAIRQHLERGRQLLARVPTDLPREFHLLAQTCNRELAHILDELESLLSDPRMHLPKHQSERLRRYRRAIRQLSFLEAIGIAALERANRHDRSLNQLIEQIVNEISYPLLPPVVTALSQQYFHIYPQLGLLSVPLSEGDFLLHLPDLLHELAHPLVTERHNPRVKPFQNSLLKAIGLVLAYMAEERIKEGRRRGPSQIEFYLRQWEKSWPSWVIEFFCDLFAVYTLGPSFAWAHLHLCAKLGPNPYQVPLLRRSTHPADNARMTTILYGLENSGYSKETRDIRDRWQQLLRISGTKAEPEYRRCFPEHILKALAQIALKGITAMGCRVANPNMQDPIYSILNQAWTEFWHAPSDYAIWEKTAVKELYRLCNSRCMTESERDYTEQHSKHC